MSMLKFILLSIFMFIGIVAFSQSVPNMKYSQERMGYRQMTQNYGDRSYNFGRPNTYIFFNSYVFRYNLVGGDYDYKYELVINNKSLYNGTVAPMLMNGIFVYADGQCVSCSLYPNGMWVIIDKHSASVIFWFKTNNPGVHFSYTWTDVKFF